MPIFWLSETRVQFYHGEILKQKQKTPPLLESDGARVCQVAAYLAAQFDVVALPLSFSLT
jgi:hypothetical protein